MSRFDVLPPELQTLMATVCEDDATQADLTQLERLAEDEQSIRLLIDYLQLDGELRRIVCRQASEDKCVEHLFTVDAADQQLPHQGGRPTTASPVLITAWNATIGFFSQEVPFACLIATVIMGAVLAVCSQIYITHHQQYARSFGPPNVETSLPSPLSSLPSPVARITGMMDVKWGSVVSGQGSGANNPEIPKSPNPESRTPSPESRIPNPQSLIVGDKLYLASGLLQLTYNSGAQVILQGPCTYEVNSPAGGFLALGKLTARVDSGQQTVDSTKPQASNIHHSAVIIPHSPPPSSLAPNPLPLFTVKTPTAVVTDLGTEFGIEVNERGETLTHVFRGLVEMRSTNESHTIQLASQQSARIEVGGDLKATFAPAAGDAFTRKFPQRVPLALFNTGDGIDEGQVDPHWHLIAISNEPPFQERLALVTSVTDTSIWLSNEAAHSRWISTHGNCTKVPDGVSYTFGTTFSLEGLRPETAELRVRFIADNHVRTIRLNGHEVPLPRHKYSPPFDIFHSIKICQGFVEGLNRLEFEVENGEPQDRNTFTPVCLRVELEGSALQDWNYNKSITDHREHL